MRRSIKELTTNVMQDEMPCRRLTECKTSRYLYLSAILEVTCRPTTKLSFPQLNCHSRRLNCHSERSEESAVARVTRMPIPPPMPCCHASNSPRKRFYDRKKEMGSPCENGFYPSPSGIIHQRRRNNRQDTRFKESFPRGPSSGLRMLTYFINRAGRGLSARRRAELEKAKSLLSGKIGGKRKAKSIRTKGSGRRQKKIVNIR